MFHPACVLQSTLFSRESPSRKMMDILGGCVSQCVALPLNLFFPGMMIKRRRRLLNIYAKNLPPRVDRNVSTKRRSKLSLINPFVLCFSNFLKFRDSFCLIFLSSSPLSSIEYFSNENLSRDVFERK